MSAIETVESTAARYSWMERIALSDVPADGPIAKMAALYADQMLTHSREASYCDLLRTMNEEITEQISSHLCVLELCVDDIGKSQSIFMGLEMHKISGLWKSFRGIDDIFCDRMLEERIHSISEIRRSKKPAFHLTVPPYPGRDHIQIYRGAFPFFGAAHDVTHLAIVIQRKRA